MVTGMAAVTAGASPAAGPDRRSPVPARTTGAAAADRSPASARPGRTLRSWPLLVLAAPAAAEVWSGWVGVAQKTGFGLVSPLPGIWPALHLDTTVTLPVGVEAYAAYALRAWLSGEPRIGDRTRRFAKWSAIFSFALGMAGQVAYHLLAQAGAARAPWPVTMIVSCLPVLVLAMGTALAHMLRADTAPDAPDSDATGPATAWSPDQSAGDQSGQDQDQHADHGSGPPAVTTRPVQPETRAVVRTTAPEPRDARMQADQAHLIAGGLAATGKPISRRALRDAGVKDDMLRPACGWLSWQSAPALNRGGLPSTGAPCGVSANRLWSMRRSLMPIVGGMDIHRKQITFDYLDTATGEVMCGQIAPADRAHLRAWLQRFAGIPDVAFAFEACTGWRYVAEELAAAGVAAHLAEPADTAAARGRKKRAKTDRADARLQRTLLADGRLPECWIPPAQVLECRALLETYHALRREHTAWVQRAHAVLFHQGAPVFHALGEADGPQQLAGLARARLSPAGQQQIGLYLRMLEVTEAELGALRGQLTATARRLAGAKALQDKLYGVGPVTGLALTCWLGGKDRFSSARKAVRFTGLDITVYSSDGKRSPGHLSRQGPPVLRWCAYEAGKAHARGSAPDHRYYEQVKDRKDGKRAALSEARKIIRQACHLLAGLGDDAFTTV